MKFRGFLFLILLSFALNAQILDKQISITFKNNTLAKALEKLSSEAGFDYSYNAKLFDDKKRISKTYKNQALRVILDDLLLETDLEYKLVSGQIIFYKKKEKAIKKAENILNGSVKDSLGDGIPDVKITDADGLIFTSTDKNGRFKIAVPNPNYVLHLTFQHKNYKDKQLKIQLNSNQEVQVVMEFVPYEKISVAETDVRELDFYASIDSTLPQINVPKLFIPANVTAFNADTLRTKFWAGGLFPPLSSKRKDAGNELNHVSAHLFTDYGAGVDGFTFSGLANVYRFSANGLSIAGIGNYVGGNMGGLQIGGVLNTNSLRTDGLQIAGVMNMTGIRQSGLQVAGINNVNRSNAYGIHVAGIGNYTHKTNVGLQIGGLFNYARTVQGIQLASIYNQSHRVQGLQIGLVNSSRRVDGLQIGLFNFAKSAKFGGQIGLFNFVKNGYKQLEFSYDEMNFVDFSFRSGVQHFYNLLKVGTTYRYDSSYYRLGYGLGSEIKIVGPLAINLEAEAYHVTEYNFITNVSVLAKFRAGIALNFKGISLFGAYNYNTYMTDYLNEDTFAPMIPIIQNPTDESYDGQFVTQHSDGFVVGLRIHL